MEDLVSYATVDEAAGPQCNPYRCTCIRLNQCISSIIYYYTIQKKKIFFWFAASFAMHDHRITKASDHLCIGALQQYHELLDGILAFFQHLQLSALGRNPAAQFEAAQSLPRWVQPSCWVVATSVSTAWPRKERRLKVRGGSTMRGLRKASSRPASTKCAAPGVSTFWKWI